MQRSHNLLDAGIKVPNMDIQEIDVIGAELLEGSLHRDMHRFGTVSRIKRFLGDSAVVAFVIDRVLQVG
jgi:hypothetical protein